MGGGTEAGDGTPRRARRCPVCGRPETARHKPFCSRRCAEVDLGRWLKGVYSIPTEEEPEPDEGQPEGGD